MLKTCLRMFYQIIKTRGKFSRHFKATEQNRLRQRLFLCLFGVYCRFDRHLKQRIDED